MSNIVFTTTDAGVVSVYASNGTAAGTTNLGLDLVTEPIDFTTFAGNLYFIGTDPLGTGPVKGSLEPVFSTDGTAAGTVAVQDGSGVLFPDNLDIVGGKLLTSGTEYAVGSTIYGSTDGVSFNEISNTVAASSNGFVVSNGTGFFDAVSVTATNSNLGLWRTDGTTAGTYSINPAGVTLDPQAIAAAGTGRTAFIDQAPSGNGTLWMTDGTAAGTSEISNAALGTDLEAQFGMVSVNGKAYFVAINAASHYSVWGTAGAAATTQVFDGGFDGFLNRPIESIAAFGRDLLIVTGSSAFVYNGSTVVTLPLAVVNGDNNAPGSYAVAGSKLFLSQGGESTDHPVLYVSDGTVAGTVGVTVPGLASINGVLAAVGNGVAFEGTDTSGKEALFESGGTTATSEELALPAGVAVDYTTVIAALPASAPATAPLIGTLPKPLYTGIDTVTGTGGVAGLQLECVTQGSYDTPGSAGWVKASVQADGDWSAQLDFAKAGLLTHVFAENGGSTNVVDLVDGTPIPPPAPIPALSGVLPSPLYTGADKITGTGGFAGLRLERITQGTYDAPGQSGWVTATVAADHTWSVQLSFTKPGMLAHVYAQNGGTGAVVDLVDGTPIARTMHPLAASVVADMTAKADVAAPAYVRHVGIVSGTGGSLIPAPGSVHAAPLVIAAHTHDASYF